MYKSKKLKDALESYKESYLMLEIDQNYRDYHEILKNAHTNLYHIYREHSTWDMVHRHGHLQKNLDLIEDLEKAHKKYMDFINDL